MVIEELEKARQHLLTVYERKKDMVGCRDTNIYTYLFGGRVECSSAVICAYENYEPQFSELLLLFLYNVRIE